MMSAGRDGLVMRLLMAEIDACAADPAGGAVPIAPRARAAVPRLPRAAERRRDDRRMGGCHGE
jgi:hypothetical protein